MTDTESKERRLELGRAAEALLKSDVFNKVVNHLITEQVAVLVAEPIGSLTATGAHATLQALNALTGKVRALASEVAVQSRNQKD